MSATLAPGQRVRITSHAIGTIRIDDPYRFTNYIADEGDEGEIVESRQTTPEGWLLVQLDHKHDDGDTLYAPVHPSMIEPA